MTRGPPDGAAARTLRAAAVAGCRPYAGVVHAAALRIELYLRGARSLKAKRSLLRPITEGLRKRYRVSVSEVDHQNAWHLATVGVAVVAPTYGHLSELLDEVERFVWSHPEVEVLRIDLHRMEEEHT